MPRAEQSSRPLSRGETAELAEGIAQLASSGAPLAEGLLELADEVSSPRLRGAYRELGQRLQEGASLEEAIRGLGNRLPEHVGGLAAAGIAAGRLSDVLAQFVRLQNRVVELRRSLVRSLAYPGVLLALLLVVFVLARGLIIEPIADLLASFGDVYGSFNFVGGNPQLPPATRLMLAMPGLDLIGGITLVTCIVVIWLCVRYSTPRVRHRLAASLPLVGPIWRNGSWAGFAGLLGVLMKEGVPLPRALKLTGDGLYDRDLADSCERMVQFIEAGHPLSACLGARRGLPRALGPLVDWGTRSGTLPEVLSAASELARNGEKLRQEVDAFLHTVRAA